MMYCAALLAGIATFSAWTLMPYSSPMTPERKARYGEWAVVAGASEGLGAAWADELASHGLNVVILARSQAKLDAVAEKIRANRGVQVEAMVVDLMSVTAEEVTSKIIADRGVGLFVFNAAYMAGGEFLSQPVEEHLKVAQLNVNTLVSFTHAMSTHMTARGHGGIVLMGSMSGVVGTAYYSTYAASKSFIASFSRALWYELGPQNVDVVGCVAGATTTPGYLTAAGQAGSGRNELIEQTSEEVVQECLAGLGRTSALATGALNKFSQGLLKHLLPADYAVRFVSYMTNLQTGAGKR